MAIDRELLVDVALYRYSRPADATGLSDAYAAWRDSAAVAGAATGCATTWRGANALLDEAGLPPRRRTACAACPTASPGSYEIIAVSGWSDWVRAAQVIARGLREVGVDASVRTYDFGAWFQRVQEGNFDLSLGWSFEGPTPYTFYRWLMASATVKPVGEAARWATGTATAAPRPTARSRRSSARPTRPRQRRAVRRAAARLRRRGAGHPALPQPVLGRVQHRAASRASPRADQPYADPSPNKFDRGECLLVLTALDAALGVRHALPPRAARLLPAGGAGRR